MNLLLIYLVKMVILYSHVSLPGGRYGFNPQFSPQVFSVWITRSPFWTWPTVDPRFLHVALHAVVLPCHCWAWGAWEVYLGAVGTGLNHGKPLERKFIGLRMSGMSNYFNMYIWVWSIQIDTLPEQGWRPAAQHTHDGLCTDDREDANRRALKYRMG